MDFGGKKDLAGVKKKSKRNNLNLWIQLMVNIFTV